MRSPLAISVGDPAGVGPEVSVRAAAALCARERLVLFGDATFLEPRLASFSVDARRVDHDLASLPAGVVGLVHVGEWPRAVVDSHAPTIEGGRLQLAILDAAIDAVREGQARALVTGPTSKEAIARGGARFVGQTEHLAARCGLADDDVTMMFLGPKLSVALVTTHLSIRSVPDAITSDRVARTIDHLASALVRLYPERERYRVIVAGLNPHAGEGGLLGSEDRDVIAKVIAEWRGKRPLGTEQVEVDGPMPAETAFRMAASPLVIGVVAMMHDQATIASKLLDWGKAANVTWGLPFVRTSVDHGVAYDAAASGAIDDEGMRAAIAMAQRLTGS